MISSHAERAITDAISHKKALFKYISPNDVGLTGSHQYGFYLPKNAWRLFTSNPPVKDENSDSNVRIFWQDGKTTTSRIVWYGSGTRSEYRLTRFGKGFAFLQPDNVGNLLILIPASLEDFRAYVLSSDEDIEEFQAALGIEAIDKWGVYQQGLEPEIGEEDCISLQFQSFAVALDQFPTTRAVSDEVSRILSECVKNFMKLSPDDMLMRCVTEEYTLFRLIERRLTEPDIRRQFNNVDDLIETAARILNRRKSRAGKSLEHHVERILHHSGIRFDSKPKIDGKVEPDILIPGKAAYEDPSFPEEKLVVLGLKTTCKDRWRQVLNEGRRIPTKHILTLQQGISSNQLREMDNARIVLVVPKPIRHLYPSDTDISILSFTDFIFYIRKTIEP